MFRTTNNERTIKLAMQKKRCLISKRGVWTLLVILALGGGKAQAQETKKLTLSLDQALQIALDENPTVIVAGQEIEKKQYAKKATVAGLLPQISASAGYTRTLKKQVMYMGGGSGGGFASMITEPLGQLVKPLYDAVGLDFPDLTAGTEQSSSGDGGIEVGLDNNWNAGFNLSMPLYAPTLYKAIQLTEIDIDLAVEQARASKQDLVNGVSKSYYQLLLAENAYEVYQQSLKQAEENLRIVTSSFQQGLVSEYDKIRAEVSVGSIRPGVIQARNAVELSKLQLKALMGLDGDTNVEVMGHLKDYEDGMYGDYLKTDTAQLANNTNLRQLEFQAKMLQKSYEMDKAAYLPTVALSGLLQWMAMNEDFKFGNYKWNPYSTLGVTVSVPLFTGGSRSNKIKQTKVQMQQLNMNRVNLKRNLNLAVESNLKNMQQSVEQLASNKENVNQAIKGRHIAQKRYEVGKGTFIELNDSELSLLQAQLTHAQSIYNFLVAKCDLDQVLGQTGNEE